MVSPLLRTAHHDLIANLTWASEVWHRGGADVIFLHLAVLFFNANMQRTGDRITKILNTKRSSRNLRFVNHTPIWLTVTFAVVCATPEMSGA